MVQQMSRSQSSRKRNLGGKRCVRFSLSVTNATDRKLSLLSVSLGKSKSEVTDLLLGYALQSKELIDFLEDKHNKNEKYRINPIVINKELHFY